MRYARGDPHQIIKHARCFRAWRTGCAEGPADHPEKKPSASRLIEVDHAFNRATGNGTNPEQLFAAGWSACFISAMKIAAARMKVTLPAHLAVDAERGPAL
jgi:organic hydroperoxide reductase OsmC/OhrA